MQEEYYSEYSLAEIKTFLMYCQMIVFHSLILLMFAAGEKRDLKMY